MPEIDIKTILAIVAAVIGLAPLPFYIRSIFWGSTRPHAYTWLVWTITQGTAVFGLWYGGGGIALLSMSIGVFTIFGIFIISLFRGTKNIKTFDTVTLVAALGAVFVWWQLDQPVLSILMVCLIDALGYMPTLRKSFEDPWSETIALWAICTGSNFIAMFALREYNFLTLGYLSTISALNLLLVCVCLLRRQAIPRPLPYTNIEGI